MVAEGATVLARSSETQSLGWLASLGFVALGVVVGLAARAFFSFTPPGQVWLDARDAFDLPAPLVSIAFFVASASGEELSKALGTLSARLRTNRLSWWIVAAFIGAMFGLMERVLLFMSWTPAYLAQFTPLESVVRDSAAVMGHAALCVLSVATARSLGGTWLAWCAGVAAASALHAAHNLLPRFIDLGWDFAWLTIFAAIMSAILVVTFILREPIAQRFQTLSGRV